MKFAKKGSPPQSLLSWLGQANGDWQPTYSNLSGLPRADVISSLLGEQNFLCVYCGRRLNPDGKDGHIDHFWPQSHFGTKSGDDRSLDYSNFFMSCGPNRFPQGHEKRLPVTCGEAKENQFDLVDYILPSDPTCEGQFAYGTAGTVVAKPSTNPRAQNMLRWLRLDDPALVYERAVLLEAVETDIQDGTIADTDKEEQIRFWRAVDGSGRMKSFGQVVARYLEDEL